MVTVHDVRGSSESETFFVNIALPNQTMFSNMRVAKGELAGADILIGMDVISQGDFAVTNVGGKSKFSFRVPSSIHIDFVEEHNKKAKVPQFEHGAKQGARPKRAKPVQNKKKKKK